MQKSSDNISISVWPDKLNVLAKRNKFAKKKQYQQKAKN